ncbi:MAG TPA: hypothetical protein VEO54_32215 [Thermoanaerobaculia bacterium]|nr:hypothetical protein [Thermoanaerobaculia bacterium]
MQTIQQLSAVILDSASDAESVDRACSELYELFSAAATSAGHTVRAATDRRLDSGVALSPALAAQCLLDGRRTRAFSRGALKAIQDVVRLNAPEPVEVLYAGTGPFAPLAFLIMPFTDPDRVRFTLLDVNAESTQAVAALVDVLGLASHVREVVCADATTYRHPADIHVLISETMRRSLAEEPFVSILQNLRPQLARGGAIVPERVTIDLALLDPATEQARWSGAREPLDHVAFVGRVFEVDAGQATRAATTIEVRCDGRPDARWLALVTRIVVYHDEILEPYASGLTTPEILWSLSPVTRDLTLELQYLEGAAPRLEWCVRPLVPAPA